MRWWCLSGNPLIFILSNKFKFLGWPFLSSLLLPTSLLLRHSLQIPFPHQDEFATKRRHELPTIGAESSASTGAAFFRSAPNMNLCSKCYRDLQVSAEQAASAKAVTEKTLSFKSSKPEAIAADIC
ncbi:Zinc finger A20 and AN1 domain-containing stress-associated protein 1 [Linum grandiflorum]